MARYLFGLALDGAPAPPDWHGLDRAIVGPGGLLTALEASLGLPPLEMGDLERTLAYRDAILQSELTSPFFANSFAIDALATSRLLLAWRDELAEAGWRAELDHGDAPARLETLAALEAPFAATGSADRCAAGRIAAILAEMDLGAVPAIDSIETLDDLALLPACWATLLARLGAQVDQRLPETALANGDLGSLQAALAEDKATSVSGDGSIRIVTASTTEAAADALATQLRSLAGEEIALLADANELPRIHPHLSAVDLPRPSAKREAAHALLQFAPLFLRSRWTPLDPQAWIELLLHPVGPIPRRLRTHLAKAIDRRPGRGTHWEEALQHCIKYARDDAEAERFRTAFEQWVDAPLIPTDAMTGIVLAEALAPLSAWASRVAAAKKSAGAPDAAEYLQGARAIAGLGAMFAAEGELTRTGAERLLAEWLESASPSTRDAGEVGAPVTLTSPAQLLAPQQHVIWWRPRPDKQARSPWTVSEANWLTGRSVRLLDQTARALADERLASRAARLTARSLTLYHVSQEAGAKTAPAGIVTRLLAMCGSAIKTPASAVTATEPVDARPLPGKSRWWRLGASDLMPARPSESFTSADSFIYSPYRWVLERAAHLWPGALFNLRVRDNAMRRGSALHALSEAIFAEDGDFDWRAADRENFDRWLDQNWTDQLAAESAHYLTPGNESAQARLKHTARQSLWTLILRFREIGITRVECEKWIEKVPFTGGELQGYIDITARRENGDTAVVDLKLGGAGKRREELRDNRPLQLATYGHLLHHTEGIEPATAFFILASSTLLTRNASFFGKGQAVHLKTPEIDSDWQHCWEDFETMWDWRRGLLDAGEIEISVRGTDPDLDRLPPLDNWQPPDGADTYSPFAALTGWDTNA